MKLPKMFVFMGGRIVKTGIAVFVTTIICHMLNWPATFAVITAIVTIEPTASESIKKAFVRFPASAIGAAYAMLFTFSFNDSAFTYAFVTLSTIITCHKLKLHHGILVATLTGAAMITTVHDHYVASFFMRLGATLIGLIVSSLVNVFVMPPKYSIPIKEGIQKLYEQAGTILEKRGNELLHIQTIDKELKKEYQRLIMDINKIENLCNYEKAEWKYHRVPRKDIRNYRDEYKRLNILRRLVHHMGILIYLPLSNVQIEKNKTDLIVDTIQLIQKVLHDAEFSTVAKVQHNKRELTYWLAEQKSSLIMDEFEPGSNHTFSNEITILYGVLSIYELTINHSQSQPRQQVNPVPITPRQYQA